jgi:translation initiation factor 3 subunit K
VQKLNVLNNLLCGAQYAQFWTTLDSDDLYADLVADVTDFEELVQLRVADVVSRLMRKVERSVFETWVNLKGKDLETFVNETLGWSIEGEGKDAFVVIPQNKENEAKGTIVRENVKFDQFSRVIKRAYEQPA